MFPHGRHPPLLQPEQPFKFSVLEICDRIKEEFQFLQAQYHSLKLECEKLMSEKTEMQRHYVMYYEMSYGLNIEMHKQAEIVKRLSAICAQIIPFLTQEHQQQVLQAVERAKQVTMGELNSIVGQQQLQHLSHHASPLLLTPHSSSMQPSSLSGASGTLGLLTVSGALLAQSQLATKEDRVAQDGENKERAPSRSISCSPPERLQDEERMGLKRKREEKNLPGHSDSDGDKSDYNLVVDETFSAPRTPPRSPAALAAHPAAGWHQFVGRCRARPAPPPVGAQHPSGQRASVRFKATRMVPAASTSPMMAPSCGQGGWTTLCAAGTCGRGGSCSSTTSAPRSSPWGTAQQESGWRWGWRAATWRSCTSPNLTSTSYTSTRAVSSPSDLPPVGSGL
ncbi:PREDICTED: transducin-like enhancer protein 2 isoform X7 [Lepidothrix coronata]|uniref:Transducin-like enhancer protein 2 isoform X7 n=1 Tax=Lepidothrix coronata TaxID=321398 RepID=A0A6J0ITH4_9PASS|nr:PREDICTED: transducin-like enhancer protein 2 isoform X7 [Lepidothrix coronata]